MGRKRRLRRFKCKTVVQTIIFDTTSYTKSKAKKWLKSHGLKNGLDVKPNSIRARQIEPSFFKNFRTINFNSGIKAVIGCTK